MTFFSVTVVLSNIIAAKVITLPLFGVAIPAGLLTYPLTFVITDLVAECWGPARARFMVLLAFGMNVLMLAIIQLSLRLPPHEIWAVPGNPYGYGSASDYQNAYEATFGVQSTMVYASLLAYMCGQLVDVSVYHRIRLWTRGRHLWLRNNLSTFVSQFVDTTIVVGIYLFWVMGMNWDAGKDVMINSYLYKACFAILDTPILYLGVTLLHKVNRRQATV